MNQLEMFNDTYTLGVSKDTNDELWTTAGFGGPALTELLGMDNAYRVTGRQALQSTAALICLDVLAQDVSKATLRLKEKLPRGKGVRDVEPKKHPVALMLALEPNKWHTWVEYVQMCVYHLCMTSNCYSHTERTNVGDPTALIPIMPGRVQDRINSRSREIFYDLSASTEHELMMLGTSFITAPERNVCHVRNRMLDGFFGYSTLAAGGPTLSMGRTIDSYARSLYAENGQYRGYFQRPHDKANMTEDVFRRTKGQLKKLMQRVRDKDDPILLEDGITFKEMSMKASESEMLKALDKQIEMICKLWRMPPHKAMHLTAVKYENLTAMEKVYVRDTLIPICKLIEARMARTLLTPEERLHFYFEFDRDEMKIFDEKVENERAHKAATSGLIEINEYREGQGYNPAPWGKSRIIPVNTVLVDADNNVIVSGAKAQGDEEKPADGEKEDDTEKPAEEPDEKQTNVTQLRVVGED